ncbi:MAG: DegT/DnrJ/EryC1/StrS family aminotransferase, partial [Bacteroidota bacterium]
LADQARHLINQAKVAGANYFHDQVGYNFRLSNLQAAVGLAQMEQLPHILQRQRDLLARYQMELAEFARFPLALEHVQANGWLPTGLFSNRKELQSHLMEHQIGCRPLWMPLQQLPPYQKNRHLHQGKKTSEELYHQGLSLPAYASLTDSQQTQIIHAIQQFYRGR